ncbi:hypothetical protein B0T24DRAFT_724670 [Lasiosphaeria ovina]|uniref:Uncharacterized protein n=1 Tax=Lasiosphaeria ovina TaxID=92902 RepID=A0AAE0JT89_9PEZI|nr:hypothetical protein B0T24DRAFT_724670 [Lasiosphaeria ovina]
MKMASHYHRAPVPFRLFLITTLIWLASLVTLTQSLHIPTTVKTTDLQPRQSNETAAPSPPWVDPALLQTPPTCVANNSIPCMWTPSRLDDCSATKCITAFEGVCMERAKRVDLSCLCTTLESDNCGTCTSPIERAGYDHWLNLTCGVLPAWKGLPQNWTAGFTSLELVQIDRGQSRTGTWAVSKCNASAEVDFTDGWDTPQYNMPSCMRDGCPALEQGWRQAMYDGRDAAWANYSVGQPGSTFNDSCGVFLGRSDVCGSVYQKAQKDCSQMCPSRFEKTQSLLWLNDTCHGAPSFKGLPANAPADISAGVSDSTYDHLPGDLVFPECANQGACGESLAAWKAAASDVFCVLNATGQYCSGNRTLVSYAQFCANISYPATCAGFCTGSYGRHDWLWFINSTCGAVPGWAGLAAGWADLLEVQLADVKPWGDIAISHGLGGPAETCPTAEANIAVFAAANIAMLLFTPILGRRKVVEWLTFGWLGEPHRRSWMYMGPAMALLQLLANTANALIIRAVPGYGGADTKTLVMLWTTRPRMAWLAILLVPYQREDAMYFSCAATSLSVEVILQLISSYTFGTVANHARWQGFYNTDSSDRLGRVAFGRAVQMMYGGALLWLLVIVLCLCMLYLSVARVESALESLLGFTSLNIMREKRRLWQAKAARERLRKANPAEKDSEDEKSKTSTDETNSSTALVTPSAEAPAVEEAAPATPAVEEAPAAAVEAAPDIDRYYDPQINGYRPILRTSRDPSHRGQYYPPRPVQYSFPPQHAPYSFPPYSSLTPYASTVPPAAPTLPPRVVETEEEHVSKSYDALVKSLEDMVQWVSTDKVRCDKLFKAEARARGKSLPYLTPAKKSTKKPSPPPATAASPDQTATAETAAVAPAPATWQSRLKALFAIKANSNSPPPASTKIKILSTSDLSKVNSERLELEIALARTANRNLQDACNYTIEAGSRLRSIPRPGPGPPNRFLPRPGGYWAPWERNWWETYRAGKPERDEATERRRQALEDLKAQWAAVQKAWDANATRLGRGRYELTETHRKEQDARIQRAITFAFVGMLGCWIAQWVFWVGFLKLYSDQGYCPPRLGTLAVNWIVFSVFGVFMGSSV